MSLLRNSLRARLLTLILLPLIVVSLLVIFWRYQAAKGTAEEIFDRSLVMLTFAISRDVALSSGDSLSSTTANLFSEASGGKVFYHVYGPDGSFITGYSSPPVGDIKKPLPENNPTLFDATHLGAPVRVVRLAEKANIEGISGRSVITVWQKLSLRDNFARKLALRSAGLVSMLVLTVAGLVWFGIRYGLKPLYELEDAIQKRSADDLSPIVRQVPKETKRIVWRLNHLFQDLTESHAARERLISNAAHQLRNPIAGIHAMAEATLSAETLAETRARIQELVTETRRTGRLTEQLLSLEKLDGRKSKLEVIDLGMLITEVGTRNANRILSKNIEFTVVTGNAPVWARGDYFLLSEALQNLLDNAVAHGGTQISYILIETYYTSNDLAVLAVENDGASISAGNATRIFERFVQLDHKQGSGQGSGLGLAIVAQIANVNDGQVELVCKKPTRFCLSLQASQQGAAKK